MYRPVKSRKAEEIITDIQDEYQQSHTTPWIIGFSGGKDSTVLLTLTWIAIRRLKDDGFNAERHVYVVCNDTLVENPIITNYIEVVLADIEMEAIKQDMPISVIQDNT